MLRIVAEGVTFWIHLGKNILETYLGNMNWYPPKHWVVLVPGYLGQVLHRGIHVQGSIARVSLIISSAADGWELLTPASGCG